jgi:cell division initiation protein
MINLTPLEVRQKKDDFRRAMRGYDPELVNDFLDLVADRMEELVKENLMLRDSVESMQEELVEYRHKEQALSDALMSAQKMREDARQHAERESDLVLREARMAAESLRHEASRQLVREEEALRQIRARRFQVVESFRRLLEREMRELEVIQETLDLDASGSSGLGELAGSGSVAARPDPSSARPVVDGEGGDETFPSAEEQEAEVVREGDEASRVPSAGGEELAPVPSPSGEEPVEPLPPLQDQPSQEQGRPDEKRPQGDDAMELTDDWLTSLMEE